MVAPPINRGMNSTLHFARDVNHLIERRRDQAAEADEVRLFELGSFQNFLAGDHDAHVDHFVVIAGEDDPHDVLADVMNVALDRGEYDLPCAFTVWPAATREAFSASMKGVR